jgi:hypothetical protein
MKAFPNVFMDYIPAAEHRGMDLRDYFAAKALQGLLASDVHASKTEFAERAYAMADVMMKERAL